MIPLFFILKSWSRSGLDWCIRLKLWHDAWGSLLMKYKKTWMRRDWARQRKIQFLKKVSDFLLRQSEKKQVTFYPQTCKSTLLLCKTWCPSAILVSWFSPTTTNPVWTVCVSWRVKFHMTCIRSHPVTTMIVLFYDLNSIIGVNIAFSSRLIVVLLDCSDAR